MMLVIFISIILIFALYFLCLHHFWKRSMKVTRNPKELIIISQKTTPELFENTIYDLQLNETATLTMNPKDFLYDHRKGDFIFYFEGIGEQITGRWILLEIFSITKSKDDTLEIQALPCRIISDGTIEIQDEMEKDCKRFMQELKDILQTIKKDCESKEGDEK